MILRNFISLRAFTVYMENSLRFEICTEVSFTTPEVMWTLIMKLPHTEVKFYSEVKSQTGLSSLRVSCKCALIHLHSIMVFHEILDFVIAVPLKKLVSRRWFIYCARKIFRKTNDFLHLDKHTYVSLSGGKKC